METVHVDESSNSKVQSQMNAEAHEPFQSATSCSKDHNPPTSEGEPPVSVPFQQEGSHDNEDRVSIGRKQKPESAKSNPNEVTNLDEIVEEEIDVDPRLQNILLFNRAKLIQKIFRKSGGVHITFSPAGSNSSKVILKGVKKFVNKAKLLFSEVVAELESHAVIECIIPRQHHGRLIGSNGVNARALSRNYSVYIEFPKCAVSSAAGLEMGTGNDGDNEEGAIKDATDPRDLIFIRGKKEENCLMARQALLDLVPRSIRVDVPFRFHRAIAGRDGRRVRFMCNTYQVSITIPHPELHGDWVDVLGPARNCEEAKEALRQNIEELLQVETWQ